MSNAHAEDATSLSDSPLIDFAWKVHEYTTEHIRFADQKAGAVIAWSGGLIGVMLAAKAHHRFMRAGDSFPADPGVVALAIFSLLAFLALGTAASCAFWCVKPRLWSREDGRTHSAGVIYWEQVRVYPDPGRFAAALTAQTSPARTGHLAEHIYVLAGIVRRKYAWVDRSIWVAFVGSALAAIVTLFSS
jgi:hypothetical protein